MSLETIGNQLVIPEVPVFDMERFNERMSEVRQNVAERTAQIGKDVKDLNLTVPTIDMAGFHKRMDKVQQQVAAKAKQIGQSAKELREQLAV